MDRTYSEAIEIVYRHDVPGNDKRLLHEILKENPEVIVKAQAVIDKLPIEKEY